jgi:hypothetical protein
MSKKKRYLCGFAFLLMSAGSVMASEIACGALHSMLELARADSFASLMANRPRIDEGYRGRLVFAFKLFDLSRDSKSAEHLLSMLPKNEREYQIWITMGDALCDSETVSDMEAMQKLSLGFSSLASQAAILHPAGIPSLLRTVMLSVQDPHSDLALKLEPICRSRHAAFREAMQKMTPDNRAWFESRAFDVVQCKALVSPESDD